MVPVEDGSMECSLLYSDCSCVAKRSAAASVVALPLLVGTPNCEAMSPWAALSADASI